MLFRKIFVFVLIVYAVLAVVSLPFGLASSMDAASIGCFLLLFLIGLVSVCTAMILNRLDDLKKAFSKEEDLSSDDNNP